MKYLYESHLSGFYFTDEYKEDTYCEICGDNDTYLGKIENLNDLIEILLDYFVENNYRESIEQYLLSFKEAMDNDKEFNQLTDTLKIFALNILTVINKLKKEGK